MHDDDRFDDRRAVEPVRAELQEIPEVEVSLSTAGSFDLMLEVTCINKAALAELTGERLRRIDGMRSSRTFQYLDLVKLLFTWVGLQGASLGGRSFET